MSQSLKQSILLGTFHLLLCIFSGALGWDKQTIIVPVVSILSIVLACKGIKLSPLVSLAIVAPFFLVYLGVALNVDIDYATYPIWIFGLLASFLTFLFLKYKVKPVFSISSLVLLVLFDGLIAWPNTFTYLTTEDNPSKRNLLTSKIVDINNNEILMEDLKGKVLLFDIWHSACYPCIKKFPEVQALYEEYKSDSSVQIISLNLPLEKDRGVRPARFTDPYSFSKMYFLNEEEYKKFSIQNVPLVLILDKNMKCRYAGQLNSGWNIFIGNARRIINRLKNE